MPRLMEKNDWMQTVADVGAAEGIWYENVSADGGYIRRMSRSKAAATLWHRY